MEKKKSNLEELQQANGTIIRNISSRDTTTCCFPHATVSDVNGELQNILKKHKTADQIFLQIEIFGKNRPNSLRRISINSPRKLV